MLAVIALSAAVVLSAADVKSEAWVVVSKRSGIARPAALQMAGTVSQTLSGKGVPNATDPADLTACKAKLLCLVEAAMKKKVAVLITIETASVLDEVVIHAEALSVEEDGKRISAFDFEGPLAQFSKDAAKQVDDTFVLEIRTTLGISAAPIVVEPAPAEEIIAEPLPTPEPSAAIAPPTAMSQTPSKSLGTQQLIGIAVAGAGIVSIGIGAGMGIKALGAAAQQKQLCPVGEPCTNPDAYARFDEARTAQSTGIVFTVIGAVLVSGGATLGMLDVGGGSDVQVTPTVSADGAGVHFNGSF